MSVRRSVSAVAVTGIAIAIAIALFSRYWIYLPGLIFNFRSPIGPNREVRWQPGAQQTQTSEQTNPNDRDPNVILILVDDLGFNDISFYGGGLANGQIKTPNIDSIGHHGVSFTNAYAGHATCAPSRAALLTGRYPTKIGFEFTPTHPGYVKILGTSSKALRKGIYHKNIASTLPLENMTLPISEITMAQAMKSAGYRTLMLGKWHLGDTNETKPINRGFDETLGFPLISRFLKYGDPNGVDWRLDDMLDRFLWANVGYAVMKDGGDRFEPDMYLTDYFAKEASKAIVANRNNPFFMFLSLTAPHGPIQANRRDYDELSKYIPDEFNRVYGAVILALDKAVGTILQTLEATGLKENTIVIFTNDNGAPNWVMNLEINKPFRGWKGTFFEGGIRIPLFIQWPAKIPAGVVVDDVISQIDLFPTLLSATKAGGSDIDQPFHQEIPKDNTKTSSLSHLFENIDGVNLLPFIAREAVKKYSPHETESASYNGLMQNIPHESLFFRSGHYSALRSGDYKLHVCGNPEKKWLFNLKTDPSESTNLVELTEYSRKLEEMLLQLKQIEVQQRESLWPSMTETAVHIDKLFEFNETYEDEYLYWPN